MFSLAAVTAWRAQPYLPALPLATTVGHIPGWARPWVLRGQETGGSEPFADLPTGTCCSTAECNVVLLLLPLGTVLSTLGKTKGYG